MTKPPVSESLTEFEAVWAAKPVLRLVYEDIFRRMAEQCRPGPTLEIGGGIGNLKQFVPDVWSSDIQYSGRLDLVADAQRLPFADQALGNIVMLDVLHHVEFPIKFLRETARVLRPGGRLVMVDPAITLGSSLFYRFLHREPVDMSVNPLLDGEPDPLRDPYTSNQAIPTLIATKFRDQLRQKLPELDVSVVKWFSPFVYPLSGGFQRWSLLTQTMAQAGLAAERHLEKMLGRAIGFRILICIDRRP